MSTPIDWQALDASQPVHLIWGVTPADIAARIGGQVYLATPYSKRVVGPDGRWCPSRNNHLLVEAASEWRAMARAGVSAVSPILAAAAALTPDVAGRPEDLSPLDAAFWTRLDAPILAASAAVAVPDLPGWHESEGIWHEVNTALKYNKPVFMMMERPR